MEAGVWYYAAIVYNEHFSGNQEELYVFNEAQYENCLLNPDTHCLPADSGTLTGEFDFSDIPEVKIKMINKDRMIFSDF